MKRILSIDPGESSGICFFKSPTDFKTKIIYKDFIKISEEIKKVKPDILIYERFTLYPSQAKALIYNEMYTSQVIGVIRLTCEIMGIDPVVQAAVDKNYVVYPSDYNFSSEHEKDAYGHAWYFFKKHLSKA